LLYGVLGQFDELISDVTFDAEKVSYLLGHFAYDTMILGKTPHWAHFVVCLGSVSICLQYLTTGFWVFS